MSDSDYYLGQKIDDMTRDDMLMALRVSLKVNATLKETISRQQRELVAAKRHPWRRLFGLKNVGATPVIQHAPNDEAGKC